MAEDQSEPISEEIDDRVRRGWREVVGDLRAVLDTRDIADVALLVTLLAGLRHATVIDSVDWRAVRDGPEDRIKTRLLDAIEALRRSDQRFERLGAQGLESISARQVSLLVSFAERWGTERGWCELFEDLLELGAELRDGRRFESVVPRGVARLLVKLTRLGPSDEILVPRAGYGTTLVRAVKASNRVDESSQNRCVGYEVDDQKRALASAYAVMAGLGDLEFRPARSFLLAQTRDDGPRETYDVVISFPPFGVQTGKILDRTAYPFGTTRTGDLLALQDALLSLKPGGRAAVVLPLGVLVRANDGDVWRRIVDAGRIEAVIQLAPGLLPDTGIPCCVVLGRGAAVKETDREPQVLIVDASKKFERGRRRNWMTDPAVCDIAQTVGDFTAVPGEAAVLTGEQFGHGVTPQGYFAASRYNELLRSRFADIAQFAALGELFEIRPAGSRRKAGEAAATLYVRGAGQGPWATTDEPRSTRALRLDSLVPGVSADFYVRFLNSELGELGLAGARAGAGVVDSVSAAALR